jgi:hypothetical protein
MAAAQAPKPLTSEKNVRDLLSHINSYHNPDHGCLVALQAMTDAAVVHMAAEAVQRARVRAAAYQAANPAKHAQKTATERGARALQAVCSEDFAMWQVPGHCVAAAQVAPIKIRTPYEAYHKRACERVGDWPNVCTSGWTTGIGIPVQTNLYVLYGTIFGFPTVATGRIRTVKLTATAFVDALKTASNPENMDPNWKTLFAPPGGWSLLLQAEQAATQTKAAAKEGKAAAKAAAKEGAPAAAHTPVAAPAPAAKKKEKGKK